MYVRNSTGSETNWLRNSDILPKCLNVILTLLVEKMTVPDMLPWATYSRPDQVFWPGTYVRVEYAAYNYKYFQESGESDRQRVPTWRPAS